MAEPERELERHRAMTSALDRIDVVVADITTLDLDAIVNAANTTLLGGGGVDGAIHRKAGPELREYCATLGGCRTGEAKITPGFRLPARYVVHTVGPFWSGGRRREPELLASCYANSLQVAHENGVKTIAFPAISTGAYRFPPDLAAEIATRTVVDWLKERPVFDQVLFCCFSEDSAERHREALRESGLPPRR